MTQAENIIATVRQPLMLLDVDRRVRLVNAAFYRMFGLTPDCTIGRPLEQVGTGQWANSRLPALVDDVLSSDTTFDDVELEAQFTGIGTRNMLLNGRRLFGGGPDSPTMALLAIDDITARLQVERERDALMDALHRSNRALTEFASIAAHDLQEPLRKVQAFGERLQTRSAEHLDEQGRDYLARMMAASLRMRTLIEALLRYARLTSQPRGATTIDPHAVMQMVLSDLEVDIQATGARIDLEPLAPLTADAVQMRQLFQNLVGNALKFRRPDTAPVIRISALHDDASAWRVVVDDNGIGFPPKYADRIFGLFQRLHSNGDYQGTGIGLALCRRIVEQHGGTLTAEGDPDRGARFTISIPHTR